jgi:hypothetical protein
VCQNQVTEKSERRDPKKQTEYREMEPNPPKDRAMYNEDPQKN